MVWAIAGPAIVGACALALVIIMCIIISWLILYYKHSKVRAIRDQKMFTTDWMKTQPITDPRILNADELKHATSYNRQLFDGKGSVRFDRFFRYNTELDDWSLPDTSNSRESVT